MNTQNSQDPFLNTREREIRSLAFYGEFLWYTGFNDGWAVMIPQLLDYISSISDELKNHKIEVSHRETSDQVRVILKAQDANQISKDTVFNTSLELQRRFHLSPIDQRSDYSFSSSPLCSAPEQGEVWFDRWTLQSFLTQMARIRYKIDALKFAKDILWGDMNGSDENSLLPKQFAATSHQIEHLENHLETLQAEFEQLKVLKYFASFEDYSSPVNINRTQTEEESEGVEEANVTQEVPENWDITLLTQEIQELKALVLSLWKTPTQENTHQEEAYTEEIELPVETTIEEPKESTQESDKEYLNRFPLDAADTESINSFKSGKILALQKLLKKHSHQNEDILKKIISEPFSEHFELLIWWFRCNTIPSIEHISEKDGVFHIRMKLQISTPIPSFYKDSFKKKSFAVYINFSEHSSHIDELHDLYHKMQAYKKHLYIYNAGFIVKETLDLSVLLHEKIKNNIDEHSETYPDELSDIEKTILQEVQSIKKYINIHQLHTQIWLEESKELIHLFFSNHRWGREFFPCHEEYIAFLTGVIALKKQNQSIVWESIEVSTNITLKNLRKQNPNTTIRIKNGKIISDNSRRLEFWDITFGIKDENELWPKMLLLGNIRDRHESIIWNYKVMRPTIINADFLRWDLLYSISDTYKIDLINTTEEYSYYAEHSFLSVKLTDVKSRDIYYVRLQAEMQYNDSHHFFYPTITPHIIPLREYDEDFDQDLKTVHADVQRWIKDQLSSLWYNRSTTHNNKALWLLL